MSGLPDAIRADLQQQRTRWAVRKSREAGITFVEAQNNYELSDLGHSHQAINNVLDLHHQAGEPGDLYCWECYCEGHESVWPCPTVRAIGDALNIKDPR